MYSLRTLLFVPADRPSRVRNAFAQRVDAVAVDLEDAVARSAKETARRQLVETLRPAPPTVPARMVRVNAVGSEWFDADIEALAPLMDTLDAVILPKVGKPVEIDRADEAIAEVERGAGVEIGQTRLIPVIETAGGVLSAATIASRSSRVLTLLFGPADLSAQLGVAVTASGEELRCARSMVALAAAAAGRLRPLDGPYLTLDDEAGLVQSTREARRLGYGGKVLIHPAQIEPVLAELAPTLAEIEWARSVDRAFASADAGGHGAIRLSDGTFVDYPVVQRARQIIEIATGNGGSL